MPVDAKVWDTKTNTAGSGGRPNRTSSLIQINVAID